MRREVSTHIIELHKALRFEQSITVVFHIVSHSEFRLKLTVFWRDNDLSANRTGITLFSLDLALVLVPLRYFQ